MTQAILTELSNQDNMVRQKKDLMFLTFKVVVPTHMYPALDLLHKNSDVEVKKMLENRKQNSSKYYPSIPCVVAKSLITKYQKNKKIKSVKRLTIPICGDKGKQVKIEGNGIRIPALFKKEIIPLTFPKPLVGHIRHVEFFKRKGVWYMSYSYYTPKQPPMEYVDVIGVDRNSKGNIATIANPRTGKVFKLGPDGSGLKDNYRRRKARLQKKGKKKLLVKLNRSQSNRSKDINHKVSSAIVNHAKEHRSAIVLEDLSTIRKGKTKRYVDKSQWAFYQLETFVLYKAALLGVPVFYVNPWNTSKECSRCGSVSSPNGKQFRCDKCGHVDHRDANAAFNIANRFLKSDSTSSACAVSTIGGAYAG